MQDLPKLIEKYGPEITKQLGIASSQLYAKLLWYVKVDGIKDFILDIVYIGTSALLIYISHVIAKKAQKEAYEYEKFSAYISIFILFLVLSFFIWSFICFMVIDGTVSDAMKFISPEYWILDQIVNKSLQK